MDFDEKLDISSLSKAYEAFSKVLSQSGELEENYYEVYRAAIIQNFEFSFELCWKLMQRWLKKDDTHAVDRTLNKKDIFRLAHAKGLIHDTEKWFEYLNARNRTSHTYDENIADAVFKVAQDFYYDFKDFLETMETRT